MAETTQVSPKDSDLKQPRSPFSLFPNLKLRWPFPPPEKPVAEAVRQQTPTEESEIPKPTTVRFPKVQVAPPMAVESEETGKTSNPIVLWQVYALGGFLVLRWVWARWNERKGSNDEPPASSDDDRNAAE